MSTPELLPPAVLQRHLRNRIAVPGEHRVIALAPAEVDVVEGAQDRLVRVPLIVAVMPALPGFFAQVHLISGDGISPFLLSLYNYAWFVGFGLAFTVYLALRKLAPHS